MDPFSKFYNRCLSISKGHITDTSFAKYEPANFCEVGNPFREFVYLQSVIPVFERSEAPKRKKRRLDNSEKNRASVKETSESTDPSDCVIGPEQVVVKSKQCIISEKSASPQPCIINFMPTACSKIKDDLLPP